MKPHHKTALRLATVALAAGIVSFGTVPSAPTAEAKVEPQWPCSTLKCTQVTNLGSKAMGIVYGTADAADIQGCYDKNSGYPAWCKASVLNKGETTYSGWDADAVGIPVGCKLQARHYSQKEGYYYWSSYSWHRVTKGGKAWHKVSGDIKLRIVGC